MLAFAITSFLAAMLIFAIQPWAGKVLLPLYGGSASVWLTTLLFFQCCVLAGYFYAHKMRSAPPLLHVALVGLTAVVPFAIEAPLADFGALGVLASLALNLSAFAVLLAATTPLIHTWLARDEAEQPWALYGASNAGSLVGLLAYPFVVEPLTTLDDQGDLWRALYVAVVVTLAFCAFSRRGHTQAVPSVEDGDAGRWFAYSFVPASLLYGFTGFLTRDIAPVPLLWVVPLAVYLVTFVIAFGRSPRGLGAWFCWLGPVVLYVTVVTSVVWPGSLATLGCHAVAFAAFALYFHGELSRARPTGGAATSFYLWVALGGVAAGIFNTLLAQLLFTAPHEYALSYGLALVLLPARYGSFAPATQKGLHAVMMVVLAVAFVFAPGTVAAKIGAATLMALAFAIAIGFPALSHVMLAVFLGAVVTYPGGGEVIEQRRSFYGAHTVEHRVVEDVPMLALVSGITQHGIQRLDDARIEPLGYYYRGGPCGEVFAQALVGPPRSVGIVGLGVGAMALYARPSDRFRFWELDEAVVALAHAHFGNLAAAAGEVDVRVEDGRLGLAAAPDDSFDLLVIDAFSSDAIPSHLLTTEAFALYGAKLTADGLLLIHTSNRHLDIDRVAVGALSSAGWTHRHRRWDPPDDAPPGAWPSTWVVAAPPGASLGAVADSAAWQVLRSDVVWTDGHSSILGALR